MKIGFIGTGNLASAIIRGVLAAKTAAPEDIYIYDIDSAKVASLAKALGVNALTSACEAARADAVMIAVKPKDFPSLTDEIGEALKENDPLVISTAAGTTLEFISSLLSYEPRLIRIMPNINAAVGQAMTAYCATGRVSNEDKAFTEKLCSAFGKVMPLTQDLFSAFTAVAGSAPAFAYMFIDELAKAAVKHGISETDAYIIAEQTVFGSALMTMNSADKPGELAVKVCSPGGTTIEGVAALNEHGLSAMVEDAIDRTVAKDKLLQKK